MTFREAAIQALKSTGNEPKSSRELWEIIDERGLYESDGKTPWGTLNVVLRKYSDDPYDSVNEEGAETIFKCDGSRPARFSLTGRYVVEDEPTAEEASPESEEEEKNVSVLTQITSPELDWKKVVVSDNSGNLQHRIQNCDRYTYVATGDPDGRIEKVKIGMTERNPDSRVDGMRTSNPSIRVICGFPYDIHPEKSLQGRFDNSRREREWFFYTKDIKLFVENYIDLSKKVVKRFKIEENIRNLDSEIIELA